jgi:hypothetical protein
LREYNENTCLSVVISFGINFAAIVKAQVCIGVFILQPLPVTQPSSQGLDQNGWTVWFAIRIKAGQKMKRGDLVGYVGSTENSTEPHVHYKIREKGQDVNPQKFLQGRS